MSEVLVMGGSAATSDLVGRRVRVWFGYGGKVVDAIEGKSPVCHEGTVRAVGCNQNGIVIWFEQEIESHRWTPRGTLVCADSDAGILLLPMEDFP